MTSLRDSSSLSTVTGPRGRLQRLVRESIGSSTALLLLGVVALISMNELNRLIAEALTADRQPHSITTLIGPTAFSDVGAWQQWRGSGSLRVDLFIGAHTAIDLVFIVAYCVLLLRLFEFARAARVRENNQAQSTKSIVPPAAVSVAVGRALVFALAGLDLHEDLLIFALISPTPLQDGLLSVLAYYTAAVSVAKWLLTIVIVLYAVLGSTVGATVRAFLGRAGLALYAQRLSVIVVVAVGALSLLSAPGLLEQVSDVYRGWFEYPSEEGSSLPRVDPLPIAVTFVAFALTGLGLFALGRQRAWHYAQLQGEPDEREDAYVTGWYYLAGAVALVAVVGYIWSSGANIDYGLTIAFVLIVALLPSASLFLRRRVRKGRLVMSAPLLRSNVQYRFEWVRAAGDLLVGAWIAIWALGPFKAFISPLALFATGQLTGTRLDGALVPLISVEIALLALTIGLPVLFRRALITGIRPPSLFVRALNWIGRRFERGSQQPHRLRTAVTAAFGSEAPADDDVKKLLGDLGLTTVLASILVIAANLVFPVQTAYWAGPVGTLVILIGCWTTIIGAITLQLGKRKPLEIFRLLRLRATPVITLLVVVPAVASLVGIAPALHAIHINDESAASQRPDLALAFSRWTTSQIGCEKTLANGTTVYPLTLIAAEGGGIRAATWTVDVVRTLPGIAGNGACAAGATFISSGASGGSIGLASFRTEDQATTASEIASQVAATAANNTVTLGTPRALSADLGGMLNGDLLGSITGVRIPSYDSLNNEWVWQDRTALQELTWATDAPEFGLPYTVLPQVPTGYTIFNSTDSLSMCKVVVSQVDLTQIDYASPDHQTQDGKARPDCNGTAAGLSNTLDLQDYIGECIFDLSWGTAAELSARFPFFSPAGRVSNGSLPDDCREVNDLQLADGGLSDNTGLGTLSDLAPDLMALIAEHNATANGADEPFIVPLVMFITNEPGTDVISTVQQSRPDILLPLQVKQEAPLGLLTPASWLTRLGEQLSSVCPPSSPAACMTAVEQVRETIPGSVAVVSPATEPSVSVPLGWTLSSFSRSRLYQETLDQMECHSTESDKEGCRAGGEYGRLGDVLDLFSDD